MALTGAVVTMANAVCHLGTLLLTPIDSPNSTKAFLYTEVLPTALQDRQMLGWNSSTALEV